MLELCKNEDGRPAVGTGKRPKLWCRACYVKECGADFQAYRVAAVVDQVDDVEGIACAKTGEVITSGGTVWLDPVETSIPALLYAGFIEPFPAPAPAKAAKTEG